MKQGWIVRIWNYLGFHRDEMWVAQTPEEAIALACCNQEYYVMKAEVVGTAEPFTRHNFR